MYKWEQLHTTILKSYRPEERLPFAVDEKSDVSEKKKQFYHLAVANPGAVSWYCGLKLEMSVWLTKALLTRQLQSSASTPGYALAREWEKELSHKMGVEVLAREAVDYFRRLLTERIWKGIKNRTFLRCRRHSRTK